MRRRVCERRRIELVELAQRPLVQAEVAALVYAPLQRAAAAAAKLVLLAVVEGVVVGCGAAWRCCSPSAALVPVDYVRTFLLRAPIRLAN